MIAAGVIEVGGGILLLLNRLVVPAACVLAATMAVAITVSGIKEGDVIPSLTVAPLLLAGCAALLRHERRYARRVGLFGWGKTAARYERRRADSPPHGWVEAQALVHECESTRTHVKVGRNERHGWVHATRTTYEVLDQDGTPLSIVVEADLRAGDVPKRGERLVIAYDPADPTDIVVLASEQEYGDRLREYVRHAIQHGREAPCEVITATPTGRVARRSEAAPEMLLTLRVAPVDGEPFEITRALWDRVGLSAGARGTLFYTDREPERGYPVFPESRHLAGADSVRAARDEFVELLTGGPREVAPGITVSSGGSTPLDG